MPLPRDAARSGRALERLVRPVRNEAHRPFEILDQLDELVGAVAGDEIHFRADQRVKLPARRLVLAVGTDVLRVQYVCHVASGYCPSSTLPCVVGMSVAVD